MNRTIDLNRIFMQFSEFLSVFLKNFPIALEKQQNQWRNKNERYSLAAQNNQSFCSRNITINYVNTYGIVRQL